MRHKNRLPWQATFYTIVACLVVALSGCDFSMNNLDDLIEWMETNGNNGTGGAQSDTIVDPSTCDSLPFPEGPRFISGALEWDFPINPDSVVWRYGDQAGSLVFILNYAAADMGVVLDSLQVWATEFGFAYLIDGTNNHTDWLLKVWTYANSTSGGVVSHGYPETICSARDAKWYMPATSMGFYFGGILTFQEYKGVALGHLNVEGWNVRNLVATGPECMEIGGIILGECKHGRKRADFRWGIWEPFIFGYYESADWLNVITP